MHLFSDYLQPLTTWIYANPSWALFITFLISFSESLAIIGSIIPGSVTMTAIGILAGSGIMRIDLTLLAASLGAVAGDSASYFLGYIFRNRITNIWPFSRYPNWLHYGKDYFAKHGGKSVLIGRFIGPLRSMIPVIAGMMHMNRWHFLLANIISAIAWAMLYVMPGVLIGAASSELSAETASRLFILILMLLILIWILTIAMKWVLKHLNIILRVHLHRFWAWSKDHPRLANYIRVLTPAHETNYYPTAALIFLFLFTFLISLIFTTLAFQETWITAINQPIHHFLQSLRTQSFDAFFIVISLFIYPLSLLTLILSIAFYLIYHRDWRTLKYWLSLGFFCIIITTLLATIIHPPKPHGLLKYQTNLHYPAIDLTFAMTFFGFLILYISTQYRTILTLAIRIILLLLLVLSGLGSVYLGDNWLNSVMGAYFIGLSICLGHWIFYRRTPHMTEHSQLPIVCSCLLLLITTAISCMFYYKKLVKAHHPYIKQYILTHQVWWHQNRPLLPIYTTNRLGQQTGLFNIQYAGSIEVFEHALRNYGWKKQSNSFLYSLLLRAGGKNAPEELPLMAQLYQNRKPALVMTYTPGRGEPFLILRLWRSNYHLRHYQQPIWLGSIHPHTSQKRIKQNNLQASWQYPFKYMLPALHGFNFNRIRLNNKQIEALPHAISPELLFIKEPLENDAVNERK
ncbi:VTT domain-containing protein [Legionella oakridgensis]|uniref:Type I secretion system n=2 Tax=Legionella oakridgensis TaxID=29423 RepID=W0B9H4_9GAMM|nr:VTT domain-containing protein [Legionella oakridgensis]AHE67203.1 type I secretion system [Legionella oakridgensis ATCC 33761 = DSM 21215]ETO93167.1 membrane-associated protein [Legionella oakridgensis RV-2-2007]KTD37998.1 secretion system protein Y [Legionella oakridgensis]STY20280.1 DedA/PAP2 domain protein [Legionella longbeachae]